MKHQIFRILFVVFCSTMAIVSPGQVGIITTVAGNGVMNDTGNGGQATAAAIDAPNNLTFDSYGNYYSADAYGNEVRKIYTSGLITTVAGNTIGIYGGDGGAATLAEVYNPSGVAVDAFGNIYIADQGNSRIRKVNTSGIISTIAGDGTFGYNGDGGLADTTKLNGPSSIILDDSGNIYFTDYGNQRVRKIDTFGRINTIAGNGTEGYTGDGGPAVSAELNYPCNIAFDKHQNLYITDYDHEVRRVSTSGIITTFAGNGTPGFSGDGGPATAALLWFPAGIAIDTSDNVYIVDQQNQRVRKVDNRGIISTIAGDGDQGFGGDGGPATAAKFHLPVGIAIDASQNLYIADKDNSRIRKITLPLIPTGIDNLESTSNEILVSPNPAYNHLVISCRRIIRHASISSVLGQILRDEVYCTQKAEVNIADFPPGVYIVGIVDDEGNKLFRQVVKE